MGTIKAQAVETDLQLRLRIGVGESAISDANLFSVMNNIQRALNHRLERVVTTGTFKCASSVTTFNATTVTVAADCVYILALYESTRSLQRLESWKELVQYSLTWHTSGDARSEVWAPIGSRHIMVYPASTITYNCVYLQETTTINSSGDTFNFPNEDVFLITDLCEIVWLVHLQLLPEADIKIKKFKEALQTHDAHTRSPPPKGHVY